MDKKERIKNEIARLTELIKESESITEQMPGYLRKNQELALRTYKKKLAALELEYMKL
ncbi:MAG TPA: hypothetical protein GX505_04870 [Clostridiales bacterium]|nr:hypothetical protein [Clostridiales bacterium]